MDIFNLIQSPSDIKRISMEELDCLAYEIRGDIIETVSKNGGHLASNLGIVELTLALHRVFSFPEDSLIFDVGHQAYAHKLITGRRDRFSTLRTEGGLSGFTNRDESEFDVMTAGHSGSSLSYAVGIAEANRIAGNGAYAIAVIGDGSFTNGMIYEAMNNAAAHNLRLIIVLNDNEMSISQNVGSLSRYFSRMRTSRTYFSFKLGLKHFFSAIPLVGKGLTKGARRIKDFIKHVLITENMFENLGLEYFGPVSGDNLHKLCSVLKEAKKSSAEKGAVVVHVNTKKGRGYKPAEDSPHLFHSTGPFDPDPSKTPSAEASAPKKKTFTEAFSESIVSLSEKDERICAVTAAMADGCGLSGFSEKFPHRFFDTGIAEEHAVTFAGGLSKGGMKPVVAIYSTFMQRVFDQVWHDVALQKSDAVFVLSHGGVVPGDGITHQGIYDVSLFAPIPGIKIHAPDSLTDLHVSLERALAEGGVSVIRYPKGHEGNYPRETFTEANHLRFKRFGDGKIKLLALTYGRISENVCAAMEEYAKNTGSACAMAVFTRIVPLDTAPIEDLIAEAEQILFVEEGIRTGGIGERFAASLAETESAKKVHICAIEDGFLPHGTHQGLIKRIGMDKDSLLRRMEELTKR